MPTVMWQLVVKKAGPGNRWSIDSLCRTGRSWGCPVARFACDPVADVVTVGIIGQVRAGTVLMLQVRQAPFGIVGHRRVTDLVAAGQVGVACLAADLISSRVSQVQHQRRSRRRQGNDPTRAAHKGAIRSGRRSQAGRKRPRPGFAPT